MSVKGPLVAALKKPQAVPFRESDKESVLKLCFRPFRYLFIHGFDQFSVVEIEAKPDQQGNGKFTQKRKDYSVDSAAYRDPTDCKCTDQHDGAANPHVDNRLKEKRETVIFIEEGRKSKAQSDEKRSEGHLGEEVVRSAEVAPATEIHCDSDDTEYDGRDADCDKRVA